MFLISIDLNLKKFKVILKKLLILQKNLIKIILIKVKSLMNIFHKMK